MEPLEHIACTSPVGFPSGLHMASARVQALGEFLVQTATQRPILFFASPSFFWDALRTCWYLGVTPVLSPDLQQGNLQQLKDQGCDSLITDSTDIPHQPLPVFFYGQTKEWAPWPQPMPPDPKRHAVYLFTSGSTGERKWVAKTFDQLNQELQVLDALWGSALRSLPFYASVSPQHIYGLLFSVLWPAVNSRPVAQARFLHWEELPVQALKEGAVIITSPTHLKILAQKAPHTPWPHVIVFSSGGPLSYSVSQSVFSKTQVWVREIYGSTETGGIAWRTQQQGHQTPWSLLPNVQVTIDDQGLLYSTSPWSEWDTLHPTGDKASINPHGTFQLLGRSDRIVKLFEKRINLGEMERLLLQSSSIQEVKIIAPPDGGHLWCALTPSHPIPAPERASIIKRCKQLLSAHFEPSLLPRHWYVGDMPYNTQGKLTLHDLQSAIQSQSWTFEPIYSNTTVSTDRIQTHVCVPSHYFYLQGHFPGTPIVPGVCQLQWVIQLIQKYWPESSYRIKGKVKYSAILTPNKPVVLEIHRSGAMLRFSISLDGKKYSSGRLNASEL